MRFRRTLQYKLTVWYGIAMALGLGIIGTLIFVLSRYHMLRHYDAPLMARGAAILTILANREEGSSLTPMQVDDL